MKLSMGEICKFTNSTPSCRNFIKGERILHAGHVINCARQNSAGVDIKIIAFCMQTSNLKSAPHEIKAKVAFDNTISDITCSCKAGLSKTCKHSVAVLLYLTS